MGGETRRRRVLVVEDNRANLRLFQRILGRRPGLELLDASTGQAGLELARSCRPDLLLLDLHLPDMGGRDLLAVLRREASTSEIPVVIVSADATPDQVARLTSDGVAAYLTKPIDVSELLGTVDRVLAGPPGAA